VVGVAESQKATIFFVDEAVRVFADGTEPVKGLLVFPVKEVPQT